MNGKPFHIIECQQREPLWYEARIGRLTGSVAASAIKFLKRGDKQGSESEERRKLRLRLVAERLTGRSLDDDTFVTRDMERGIKLEAAAGLAYEVRTGGFVRWCGFLQHHELMAGCSLDGYVGEDVQGIIEIKVPRSTTHLEYLLAGTVPEEYMPQATHNLWISGAEWCDFVSYDDRFPIENLQLFVHRITRDQVDIAGYAEKALTFLRECDRDYWALRTTYDLDAVLAAYGRRADGQPDIPINPALAVSLPLLESPEVRA